MALFLLFNSCCVQRSCVSFSGLSFILVIGTLATDSLQLLKNEKEKLMTRFVLIFCKLCDLRDFTCDFRYSFVNLSRLL